MALTGQYQFRKTFGGKVVLQVEEEVPTLFSWFGKHRTRKRWRDATLMDLSAPALRILLDWRFKPHRLTRIEVERTGGSAERAYSAAAPQQPPPPAGSAPGILSGGRHPNLSELLRPSAQHPVQKGP